MNLSHSKFGSENGPDASVIVSGFRTSAPRCGQQGAKPGIGKEKRGVTALGLPLRNFGHPQDVIVPFVSLRKGSSNQALLTHSTGDVRPRIIIISKRFAQESRKSTDTAIGSP